MTVCDLADLSAAELAGGFRAGRFTPVDALEASIARFEQANPAINAFVTFDAAGARTQAEASAVRFRNSVPSGALDGVPVSFKDNLYVKGLPAKWGSLAYQDFVAPVDDICAERMRKAGAVIVGKTTTPEFALMGRTESRLSGITRNPLDTGLTPGGSSGGAVASVKAGITPVALGTDAGGSIRMPAAYTGLYGLRPSNAFVPRRFGFLPMALDFQVIGLTCRSIDDLELMVDALAGPDLRDPASLLAKSDSVSTQPLRIGWFNEVQGRTVDREVAVAHDRACERLAELDHRLEPCDAPFDVEEIGAIWSVLTSAGAARAVDAVSAPHDLLTDQVMGLAEAGRRIAAPDYVNMLDRLQVFRARTSANMGDFDILVTPTTAAPAFPVGLADPLSIDGKTPDGLTQGMFCGWVNAMGYCALNVPGYGHPDGRPIGIQLIARPGKDRQLLALARQMIR